MKRVLVCILMIALAVLPVQMTEQNLRRTDENLAAEPLLQKEAVYEFWLWDGVLYEALAEVPPGKPAVPLTISAVRADMGAYTDIRIDCSDLLLVVSAADREAVAEFILREIAQCSEFQMEQMRSDELRRIGLMPTMHVQTRYLIDCITGEAVSLSAEQYAEGEAMPLGIENITRAMLVVGFEKDEQQGRASLLVETVGDYFDLGAFEYLWLQVEDCAAIADTSKAIVYYEQAIGDSIRWSRWSDLELDEESSEAQILTGSFLDHAGETVSGTGVGYAFDLPLGFGKPGVENAFALLTFEFANSSVRPGENFCIVGNFDLTTGLPEWFGREIPDKNRTHHAGMYTVFPK